MIKFNSKHDLKGTYLWVDESVKDVMGYDPIELIGTNAYDYFNSEDLAKIVKSHMNIIEEDKLLQSVTYRIRHKNGNYIWVTTTSKKDGDILSTSTKKLSPCQILLKLL